MVTGRLTGSTRPRSGERPPQPNAPGDLVSLARAALGLGGIWIQEHRTAETWHAYMGLLERTIDKLPVDDDADLARLRAGLELRLLGEQASVGAAEPDQVLVAFEKVRAIGSTPDLLAGLSLLRHVMLGPPYRVSSASLCPTSCSNGPAPAPTTSTS